MGRPPIGKRAMTSTERVHRFRAKHRPSPPETKRNETEAAALQRIRALEARVHELEAALASERARREAAEAKAAASPPKAAKPPLPPDEQRERTIKGLRTQVRNLKAEMMHMAHQHLAKIGVMDFETMGAISKALHPDRKLSADEREAAYKLFRAWKADKDKTARRAKG